jgi:DNA-binding response OmpR family regulator
VRLLAERQAKCVSRQGGENMPAILAIDKDMEVYNRQAPVWASYGIGLDRVDSITEAISILSYDKEFFFVGINEDTNPDYLLLLPILRDVTSCPIFIITSTYTPAKKADAIHCGADGYDPFSLWVEDNVFGALELLKLRKRWENFTADKSSVLVGGGIILSPLRRNVLVNGVEVVLTKKEFDILFYLMSNRSILLTYDQIAAHIWGNDYFETTPDAIRAHVKRLKNKLEEASPSCKRLNFRS